MRYMILLAIVISANQAFATIINLNTVNDPHIVLDSAASGGCVFDGRVSGYSYNQIEIPVFGNTSTFWFKPMPEGLENVTHWTRVTIQFSRTDSFIKVEVIEPASYIGYLPIWDVYARGNPNPTNFLLSSPSVTSNEINMHNGIRLVVDEVRLNWDSLPYVAGEETAPPTSGTSGGYQFGDAPEAIEIPEINYDIATSSGDWDIVIQGLPGMQAVGTPVTTTIDWDWYVGTPIQTMFNAIMIGLAGVQAAMMPINETRRN
ncbi:hypothetical protein [Mucisphaera calidilacus]|uniref:Uncharacterized protein n=1 Tax=Mucisphaera calidilacus TaxID=2527982 RepID=A0A518BTY5_9BACT|nr:hypothetical protein [Mucisphaera calidilacus]QDU70441.1 hypothetical protein Pan265_02680 [Mucisphaera calidilacus]